MMTASALPVPEIDADSEPYWQSLAEECLRVQKCAKCGRLRLPAIPHCPYCGQPDHEWTELSGRGAIYSWIVVRQAFHPEFTTEVPYTLATVDLDEGVRLVARVDQADHIEIGQRVVAAYVHHPAWTELRFVPSGRTE